MNSEAEINEILLKTQLTPFKGKKVIKYYTPLNEENKPIHEDLSIIITEEYGISRIVENSADLLTGLFFEALKTKTPFTDKYGTEIQNGTINSKILDKDIVLYYYVYDFKNINDYEFLKEFYDLDSNFDREKMSIKIVVRKIGGKLEKGVRGIIQHELGHLFEYEMSKGTETSEKEAKLYNLTMKYAFKFFNDEKLQDFISLMYYSFENEQIGFTNGLDGFMKENPDMNPENSPYFSILELYKKILTNFSEYKSIGKALYNKSDRWIFRRFNLAYRNYCRRFGRVLTKYVKK